MGKTTVLYEQHVAAGAKMVDFSGWDMPIHYGSQLKEHNAVRKSAGVFDVSHMTIVDVKGAEAKSFLQYLLANDVAKLKERGKALYTAMLNEQGGVIDDLIAYNMSDCYRLVVNCATREKDLAWMQKQAQAYSVTLEEQPELAIVAVQGPQAIAAVCGLSSPERQAAIQALKVFQGVEQGGWFIARTGYTGEDGLEIMLPNVEASAFWQALLENGVAPIGLGARDTLRLEAGMNLYGADMDEAVSPLAANMAWTIAWQPESRNFIGREALSKEKSSGVKEKLFGLVLEGRGVLRGHQKVLVSGLGEGEITSGSFSPTLGHSIALARLPAETGDQAEVDIRGKRLAVKVVHPPFVRNGQRCF